jgi:hypothetical protein
MAYKRKGGKLVRVVKSDQPSPYIALPPFLIDPCIALPPFLTDPWRNGMRQLTQAAASYQTPDKFFHFPKSAACLHEAGHCVVSVAEGRTVKKARVWSEASNGRECWLGDFDRDDRGWDVDLTDLQHVIPACSITIAGRISERLFKFSQDDFNLVAGLDELVQASLFCLFCATKSNPNEVSAVNTRTWSYLIHRVEKILLTNEATVRTIAEHLAARHEISTAELRRLTANVARYSPDITIPIDVEPALDPIERLAGFGAA